VLLYTAPILTRVCSYMISVTVVSGPKINSPIWLRVLQTNGPVLFRVSIVISYGTNVFALLLVSWPNTELGEIITTLTKLATILFNTSV
jgi:hypothetical protein